MTNPTQCPGRRTVLALGMAAGVLAVLLPAGAVADAVNASLLGNVAIKGYDPVAYHTEGRPVEGSQTHVAEWNGANWHFASADNRDLFLSAPEAYAPAYGGYCAYGVAKNSLVGIDPHAWSIQDGILYLNYNQNVQETWLQDIAGHIDQADGNWPALAK